MNRSAVSRRRRGSTLVEVLTAAGMAVAVISAVVAALLSGMQSWARGAGKINAEVGSQQTLRAISSELRQAMAVTVDANGRGLSYRLPATDAAGAYTVPAEWDGVVRRIAVSSEGEVSIDGRIVADGVLLTDPARSGAGYAPFTAGAGSITRRLDVMLVIRQYGAGDHLETSRIRETIYLRNIPSLTQ